MATKISRGQRNVWTKDRLYLRRRGMSFPNFNRIHGSFQMIIVVLLMGVLTFMPQPLLADPGHTAPLPPGPPPPENTGDPQFIGSWEDTFTLQLEAVHMVHLPTGKILMWDEPEDAGLKTILFDPTTGVETGDLQPLTFFCAGHAGLGDGRFLIAGGVRKGGSDISTAIFDPFTETWTQVANMNYERYYPTLTTLSDGRVISLGGTHSEGKYIPEIFDPQTGVWTALPAAYKNMGQYPRTFLTPDDQIMAVSGAKPPVLDINTQTWGELSKGQSVNGGPTGMYDAGKILSIGSLYKDPSGEKHNTGSSIIDLNHPTPTFGPSGLTEFERYKFGNLVLLPDGTALATGGINKEEDVDKIVYAAELWDPQSGTWTTLANGALPRLYHSTSILLEDGRVLTAGGDEEHYGQIFSPPYLFKGPRPTVTSAPSNIGYGETFHISTPDVANVTKVSLLRLGAVTHAFDQNQRFMWLNSVPSGSGINVEAPAGSTLAPPGAYALFLISDHGVPSHAHYVIVGEGQSNPPPTAPPVAGGENLSLNAVASASSTFDNTFDPSLAIDGSVHTSWRPATDFPTPNWFELDFGSPQTFGTVVIEQESILDFDLEYHDGTQWVTILSGTDPGFETFPPVATDRIRILLHSVGNIDRVRIFEFDVWSAPLQCAIDSSGPTQIGNETTFTGIVDNPPVNLTHTWNFGDGTFSSEPTATHSYQVAGNHHVSLTVQDGDRTAVCTRTHIAYNPLTANRPTRSSTIVFHSTLGAAVNVNPDNDTVSAVNTSGTKLWEAPVGDNPSSAAIAPTGDIWVVNREDATISVLGASNGASLDTYNLPRASRPYGIVFSPDGNAAYVSLEGTGELLALDPTGTITGILDVGPKPRGIAVSADSSRIFTTRFISPSDHGVVTEVEASTFSIARSLTLAFDTTPDSEEQGRGVPNYLSSVVISPDGRGASVGSKKDNTARGQFRDGQPLTFENTVRAIISKLDLLLNSEDLNQRTDLDDSNLPSATEYNEYGNQIFVALLGSNRIEIRDAYDQGKRLGVLGDDHHAHNGAGHNAHMRLGPVGLTFNDDYSILFVHNFLARTVALYNVSGFKDASDYSAHEMSVVHVVENETLSPEVLLGKQIFYDSSDARMSKDGYISCASCHIDGMSDERVWDFTDRGEGFRNTISLLGRGGMGHGNVHWTANFDEIQDFENDIRNGFSGTGLMDDTDFFSGTRSDPLGDTKAGISSDLDALASYVTSLTNIHPSPYRAQDGTLTPEAEAGKLIFEGEGNCASCHSGSNFTDTLRHDVGTIQPHSGQGISQPLAGTGFDTPTLLGIWETAPYLHDGSATTLYDVIENPNHGSGAGLTANQKDQLIAFLLELGQGDNGGNGGNPGGGGGTDEVILIEGEDYNPGGEGIGYHDTTSGNHCGDYRQDDVDINAGSNGITYICRPYFGEWLAYDVSFQGGDYDLSLRIANKKNSSNAIHLKIDGVDVTGPILVPVTGNLQNWTTISPTLNIPITPGDHQVTIHFEGGGFSFDWWQLSSQP